MEFFLSPIAIGIWFVIALITAIGLLWCFRRQRRADRAWNAMFTKENFEQWE
jgi:hypothetical protein